MEESREYAYIVEFSFNLKEEQYVVRFLDNNSYVLKVDNLPKKMLTRKPQWEKARLSEDKTCLLVPISREEERPIPFHVIHARGSEL